MEEIKKLKLIQKKFDEIDTLYNELPDDLQAKIIKTHSSESKNLPHCIRRGLQAISEYLQISNNLNYDKSK